MWGDCILEVFGVVVCLGSFFVVFLLCFVLSVPNILGNHRLTLGKSVCWLIWAQNCSDLSYQLSLLESVSNGFECLYHIGL